MEAGNVGHLICAVQPHGIAYRRGVRPGDTLLKMNGEDVLDEIDYQALSSRTRVDLTFQKADGSIATVRIIKQKELPLGLEFGDSMACTPRRCHNKCVFCFIDQNPPGLRDSLYVKDDDWRLSLMMGNFVTLTNVDDREFDRILRRKASPLYISVHTTDPALRVRMMHNKTADRLMERLEKLKEAGLKFHCQIVLCPGWNDGAALEKTINDLAALRPAMQTMALVPVGLTKYRDGLEPLRCFTRDEAKTILETARQYQEKFLREFGSRIVFPSDEMYMIAGEDVPPDETYEGYPQLENGVGLLRQTEEGLRRAAAENTLPAVPRRVRIPCGVSVARVMEGWMAKYAPQGVQATVQPIVNRFFGETVTVTGLLTGGDLADQMRDADDDEILLSRNTLREEGDLFLDDMSIDELRKRLKPKITLIPGSGEGLFTALLGLREP